MDAEDRKLLQLAQKGDPRAMDTLLAQHEKQVYRFGLRMCGSEDAAKEVLQQTLLTAFRSLPEFRGDAELSTWLYQIARSFCGKTRRKRVDEPATLEPLENPEARGVASEAASPEDAAHARQVGQLLEAAILGLAPPQREVLILRDVEGLSAEEAAKVLGITVANLKTRLHRARAELRRRVVNLIEPESDEHNPDAGGPECKALAESLGDFAATDVDKTTCERIEEHLASCPRCAGACESLKRTVSLCKHIPGDEVPPSVKAAVRRALAQARVNRVAAE